MRGYARRKAGTAGFHEIGCSKASIVVAVVPLALWLCGRNRKLRYQGHCFPKPERHEKRWMMRQNAPRSTLIALRSPIASAGV